MGENKSVSSNPEPMFGGMPQRKFENRRIIFVVAIMMVLFACVAYEVIGVTTPAKFDKVLAAGPTSAVRVTVPTAIRPTSGPGGQRCRLLQEMRFEKGIVPAGSLVVVNGFSYAEGGRVYIADPGVGWTSSGVVACPGELTEMERSYYVTPVAPTETATPTPGKKVGSAAQVRVIQTVVVAGPTVVVQATPSNGIWRGAGDCFMFNVQGVKEIWVNDSHPVAGGSTMCGVYSFKVVVR